MEKELSMFGLLEMEAAIMMIVLVMAMLLIGILFQLVL